MDKHSHFSRRYYLVALILVNISGLSGSASGQVNTGEVRGTPWVGHRGTTETIADIMAREKFQPYVGPPRLTMPEPEVPEVMKQQNPNSPAAPRWPMLNVPQGSGQSPTPNNPQSVGTSWLGGTLAQSGFVPPDAMGCVGTAQFLVCVNGIIKVFDKAGNIGGLNTSTDNFFTSVRNGSGTSDPRVRFDRLSQRWFVEMITVNAPNRVMLAVSSGSTITSQSSFTFYYFQQDSVGTTPNSDTGGLADYCTMGIDNNAIYIGGNIFNSAGNAVIGVTAFVIRKTSVLSGGPIVVTAFRQIGSVNGSGAGPWTAQGVTNDDPNATEGYFVGVDNASFGLLDIRRVSTPGGSPTLSGNLQVTVPTTVAPIPTRAKGTPTTGIDSNLDALDDRLFAASMFLNSNAGTRSLWTAHNIEVNSSGTAQSGGGRNGSRWYEITNLTGTPTLNQSGTLFDNASSNPRYFWIPSVAMSGQGHMALGSSYASANDFAGVATAGRFASDALGTIQSPTLAQVSTTAYNVSTPTVHQRWGDYSLMTIDPNDNMTIWAAQEYCDATNDWGLRVFKLIAPPPATSDSSGHLPAGSTSVNITVRGAVSTGSGFYDPGSDPGGPGFSNHISATVNGGGVTVNSVSYNDPTHVTLNLTVASNAATGARTVTVTNPDSQSVTSATGILTIDPPLPVQLASFTASSFEGSSVLLKWATLSEVNNYGFEVQRSSPQPLSYLSLPNSFVPGHNTTLVPQQYSYLDATAGGGQWMYRLKQMDLDGTVHYGEGISANMLTSVSGNGLRPLVTALLQNYPDPFNPSTVIRYSLAKAGLVTLKVYNLLGEEVATLVNGTQGVGEYNIEWTPRNLASGTYIYRLQTNEFVQSRKLILLK